MKVPFAKYHGAGNDFVLIDDRQLAFPISQPGLISSFCLRSLGIGADGLILLQPSAKADFRMRIFNADGSEPPMCGNGIRCLVSFITELGWDRPECAIETGAGVLQCRVENGLIGACLGFPRFLFKEQLIDVEGKSWKLDVVDTGVPHGVIFVEDFESFDLIRTARSIRFHPQFSPGGINVNFVQILPEGTLAVRTYERGVEDETLSCGTGAAAVGWLAAHRFSWVHPISICNQEQKPILEIRHSESTGVELWGPANRVFEGYIEVKLS
jgi:diaminopimelate epimerase